MADTSDHDDSSENSNCSSLSSTDVVFNLLWGPNRMVKFIDKKTGVLRDFYYLRDYEKETFIDLTKEPSSPSSPSSVQFLRVTPPTSAESILPSSIEYE